VTAKKKSIEHGVEASEEIEFAADAPDAVRALFAYLGLRPFLKKKKRSQVFAWSEAVSVELNTIDGLGDFVEVETLLEEGAGGAALERARGEVRGVLKALGVAEERIEARPYMVLLRERGVGIE
jgi:predicted adenylyl cyclase CyaB